MLVRSWCVREGHVGTVVVREGGACWYGRGA